MDKPWKALTPNEKLAMDMARENVNQIASSSGGNPNIMPIYQEMLRTNNRLYPEDMKPFASPSADMTLNKSIPPVSKKEWDGTPYEGNSYEQDSDLRRSLLGAKDAMGRQTHRGMLGGVFKSAKELFGDADRMALLQTGLGMMNPNNYYDNQGFHSTMGGINRALGQGLRTRQALMKPRELGFKEKQRILQNNAINLLKEKQKLTPDYGHIKATGDGRFVNLRTGKMSGSRKPVDLNDFETFAFNKMRENPLYKNITPRDIKENRVPIPNNLFSEYSEMKKVLVQPDITYANEYLKKQAGNDMDMVTSINESAESASLMDAELDTQMNLLNNENSESNFGPSADWKHAARRMGFAMGLPIDPNNIATYEAFQKSSMEMLLEQLRKQKGPQTEGDAIRALQTLPQAGNTILGSKYIIAMKKSINARALAKQRFMDEYLNDESRGEDAGLPKGLARAWSKSDVGKRSIFNWMATTSPQVLSELYRNKILTGKEIEKIVLEME